MKALIRPRELKLLLKNEGISQRELARMLDIDERTVRKYIKGDLVMPRMFQLAVSCILDHDDGVRDAVIGFDPNCTAVGKSGG